MVAAAVPAFTMCATHLGKYQGVGEYLAEEEAVLREIEPRAPMEITG